MYNGVQLINKVSSKIIILLEKNQTRIYLLPGKPSEDLFVQHEPTASITALDV